MSSTIESLWRGYHTMRIHGISLAGAICASVVFAGGALAADTSPRDAQIDALQQQVKALLQQQQEQQAREAQQQQQLRDLQQQLQTLAVQVKSPPAPSAAANGTAAAPVPTPRLAMSPNNRPTIASADGQNSIGLSSILNLDAGGYSYTPHSSATTPQSLQNGVNARRARIGVNGVFLGDWVYDLQYDFGNYDDALTDTSAPKSGVKSAFVTYKGLKPVSVDFGYLSVPFTLDQATANVDYMFMEHPIPQALAIAVVGGDSRSAVGLRASDDRGWIGAYVTGPKAGTSHTTSEQLGGTLRGAYQVVQTPEATLHLGADAARMFKSPGTHSVNLSIEPELSIDPTAAYGLTLGNAANPLTSAGVYGVEAAGGYRSLFFQGEYFLMTFDRTGLPRAVFNGGYLQTSWTMTGEHRPYNPDSGAYGRITPASPLSMANGGYGAWELAARVSTMDLRDHFVAGAQNTTAAVDGGTALMYTLGLNWYPNNNLMFRLNYLHGGIGNLYSGITAKPSTQKDSGSDLDALALRAQVTF